MVPLPLKLDNIPPETVTSDAMKFVEGSLRVKLRVAFAPEVRLALLVLTAIVGGVVSNEGRATTVMVLANSLLFSLVSEMTPVASVIIFIV